MEQPCLTCREQACWTVSDLSAWCLQCRLRHCRWFVWQSGNFEEQLLPCSVCLRQGPDRSVAIPEICEAVPPPTRYQRFLENLLPLGHAVLKRLQRFRSQRSRGTGSDRAMPGRNPVPAERSSCETDSDFSTRSLRSLSDSTSRACGAINAIEKGVGRTSTASSKSSENLGQFLSNSSQIIPRRNALDASNSSQRTLPVTPDHPCANETLRFVDIDVNDEVRTLCREIIHSLAYAEISP